MRTLFQAPDGLYGFLDEQGNAVIAPIYAGARSFSEGVAQVESVENGIRKTGFIDEQGNLVIPMAYNYAMSFQDGLAPVCIGASWVGGKFGCIDHQGREVIPIRYDYLEPAGVRCYAVKENGSWSLIDASCTRISPLFPTQKALQEYLNNHHTL